ncbi:helix-turn-helix domain-containing protein [Stieleria mannarensis]|uniref:helix-turn-helix domain-containing protein n=1 Tax=Stieleria mannarensis TaxID=2755585 RepID=UPI0015FF9E3E|nr:helix-turn-helix domain-containing protein [Rhodopirellula sp. JC639]
MKEEELFQRLERIELLLENLTDNMSAKEFYSTSEVAEMLGRAEFTVREWCRHGRILAEKRPCGRGRNKEWMISHDEVQRIRNEGLLPL